MYGFHWVSNAALKEGLQHVASGAQLGFTEAIDVLKLLGAEAPSLITQRVREEYYRRWYPTKRHGSKWTNGNPKGIVFHYTSVDTAASTLRWFSNEPRPAGSGESSAHYLVDIDGSIIQLVDPLELVAWHATVCNATHIGIENVNCGKLFPVGGNQFRFMDKYNYRVNMARPPEEAEGKWWEPYSINQLISNIVIGRLMLAAVPMMRPENFIPHSAVPGANKIDTGPLWPMKEVVQLASVGNKLNILTMSWANKSPFLTEETRLSMKKEVATALKPIIHGEPPVRYVGQGVTQNVAPSLGNSSDEVCAATENILDAGQPQSVPAKG